MNAYPFKYCKNSLIKILLMGMTFAATSPWAVSATTPQFAELHRDQFQLTKEVVLKKMLFSCGMIDAAYHGINDLIAVLQNVKKMDDPRALSAQLLAIQIGLVEKPDMLRYIADEIKFCEVYPNFPRGFDDSPEGPELMSAEFYKIADHIENLKINYQLTDIAALRKEAERIVSELFWFDSDKMRTLGMDILNFLRMELKEDLPFEIFNKPFDPKNFPQKP